jgi:hypothetical protein
MVADIFQVVLFYALVLDMIETAIAYCPVDVSPEGGGDHQGFPSFPQHGVGVGDGLFRDGHIIQEPIGKEAQGFVVLLKQLFEGVHVSPSEPFDQYVFFMVHVQRQIMMVTFCKINSKGGHNLPGGTNLIVC